MEKKRKYKIVLYLDGVVTPDKDGPVRGPYWCVGEVGTTKDADKAGTYTDVEASDILQTWMRNRNPPQIVILQRTEEPQI